jgi:hypothetical protein
MQTVHLNGGPWHDQVLALEDGRDHLHILGVMAVVDMFKDPPDEPQVLPRKEGMYSRVSNTQEFEWDGWVSHD